MTTKNILASSTMPKTDVELLDNVPYQFQASNVSSMTDQSLRAIEPLGACQLEVRIFSTRF